MKNTALLRRRILSRRASVGVMGPGFVGSSLAYAATQAGFPVTAMEGDPTPSPAGTGADQEQLAGCEVLCICVSTSMNDGSALKGACSEVVKHLQPGTLVIVESCLYPGAMEHEIKPLLEGTGLSVGRDILLAYSPHRIDQGNDEYPLRSIPRVIGGITPEATGLAALFYEQIVDKVIAVSSCRVAELSNLLEGMFRHVNVALVNEMAILCHDVGVEVWEVLEAASSKPFGFMTFAPGPGVGGAGVWVDSVLLARPSQRNGEHHLRMLEQAQHINRHMPGYVVSRIADALNDRGKAMKGANVFVLGVAYKENISDVSGSPALKVMSALARFGARISFHDPNVRFLTMDDKVRERTELTQRALSKADCVALLTRHRSYDLEWIAQHAPLIFDARNAYGSHRPASVIAL